MSAGAAAAHASCSGGVESGLRWRRSRRRVRRSGVACARVRSRPAARGAHGGAKWRTEYPPTPLAGINVYAAGQNAGYVAQIPELVGSNYKQWRKLLDLALLMLDIDSVMTSPCPKAPAALVRGENETNETFKARERAHVSAESEHQLEKRKWEISNKKCLKIMQTKMSEAIRASIPEKNADGVEHTAAEYLAIVDSQHTRNSKTYASTTISNLVTMKYNGGGIRDHILKMSNMNGKLAEMDMVLPDEFVVHLVFKSLPPEFSTFAVNYNSMTEKWDMHKLISMCVQEEERLKAQNGGSVNTTRFLG